MIFKTKSKIFANIKRTTYEIKSTTKKAFLTLCFVTTDIKGFYWRHYDDVLKLFIMVHSIRKRGCGHKKITVKT